MTIQYDLFNPPCEGDTLKEEIKSIKKELGNVRRGLFARHNELAKMFLELKQELEELKRKI